MESKNKIRKILLNLAFISSLFIFVFSAAAQENGPIQDISIELSGDSSYNPKEREIILPVKVTNNSDKFFDDLYYEVMIYQGDSLKTEGYLFEGLKHMGSAMNKFGSLMPNEEGLFQFSYKHSGGIPSGSYFIKIYLVGKDGGAYAADFTRDPIKLTGDDSFLGSFACAFRTDGKSYDPIVGTPLDPSISPEAVMIFGSGSVAEKIKKGKYYIQSSIFEREMSGSLVSNNPKKVVNITVDEPTLYFGVGTEPVNEEFGLVAKDSLGSGMKPGTYRVVTVLLDEQNKEVSAPCYFRWVVRGSSGRIGDITSRKNYFSKNENYDLKVKVFGPADDSLAKATLQAELFDIQGKKVFSLSKELELGGDPIESNFSDFSFVSDTKIKKVSLKLLGSQEEIFDQKDFEYKDKVFTQKPDKLQKDLLDVRKSAFMLAILLCILALGVILFKKSRGKVGLWLIILLSAQLLLGVKIAGASHCYPHGLQVWNSNLGVSCGTLTGYVYVSAGNCINGLIPKVSVNGGPQFNVGFDPGHVLENLYGPYTYNESGQSIFNVTAYADGHEKNGLPACHATPDSDVVSTVCKVNGACGSANGKSYVELSDFSSQRCANGTLVTDFKQDENGFSWGCNGIGGGSNIPAPGCKAMRKDPSVSFTFSDGATAATAYINNPVTLKWYVDNANACWGWSNVVPNGGWSSSTSGSQKLSGSGSHSQSVFLGTAGTISYSLNCGIDSGSVDDNVYAYKSTPTYTINLTVLGQCTGSCAGAKNNSESCGGGTDLNLTENTNWTFLNNSCDGSKKCQCHCSPGYCWDPASSRCVSGVRQSTCLQKAADCNGKDCQTGVLGTAYCEVKTTCGPLVNTVIEFPDAVTKKCNPTDVSRCEPLTANCPCPQYYIENK